ncbi:winged helix DNA-binding protein [Vibrio sp.]|nr:winged helix DNA-binding protein [Vibrio sp.]
MPIVSSSHLAEEAVFLSEFEYALNMVNHAFQRWMQSCSSTCGYTDLSPLDILVIHNIQHRERPKRIADVAFTLNLEDLHNVSYSVRKLAKKGLVEGVRKGKDTYYQVNEKGHEFCLLYRDIRRQCLVDTLKKLNVDEEISDIATTMRTLSGFYDQASRAARSL